jgi:hypothetical protein
MMDRTAPMSDATPALDELRAIRRMIADTRRSTGQHWAYLVIWGVLGVVASLVSDVLLRHGRVSALWSVWGAYVLVGAAAARLFGDRERERARGRTFASRVLGATWTAIGITSVLVCLAAGTGSLPPQSIPGVVALLVATGLCAMGALLEFPLLYGAATLWWAGGALMLLRPTEAFTVEAGLFFLGYLLPASLLRRGLTRDDDPSDN